MEAMACALPVIVTQHSAPLDYLTAECSYLLSVQEMQRIDDLLYYPPNSGVWAQPDISDLKRLMRHVFEHRDEAKHKGSEARGAVTARWTWRDAAIKASSLLQ
jgi:glycosyltransferase involved in cell wall biosynthesis